MFGTFSDMISPSTRNLSQGSSLKFHPVFSQIRVPNTESFSSFLLLTNTTSKLPPKASYFVDKCHQGECHFMHQLQRFSCETNFRTQRSNNCLLIINQETAAVLVFMWWVATLALKIVLNLLS